MTLEHRILYGEPDPAEVNKCLPLFHKWKSGERAAYSEMVRTFQPHVITEASKLYYRGVTV